MNTTDSRYLAVALVPPADGSSQVSLELLKERKPAILERLRPEVLGDEVMAAALIDRVLHHCHIVNIRGNSYRMRHHTEVWKALHPDDQDQPAKEAG